MLSAVHSVHIHVLIIPVNKHPGLVDKTVTMVWLYSDSP